MSGLVNLDAIAETLSLDLMSNPLDGPARERALGRYVYALGAEDQAYVMAHALGTVLAVLEEVQKANPLARAHVNLTLRLSRQESNESKKRD